MADMIMGKVIAGVITATNEPASSLFVSGS
jgi:hypothetical protein